MPEIGKGQRSNSRRLGRLVVLSRGRGRGGAGRCCASAVITRALSALRSDTRRGRRRRWWGSFAVFTLLISIWSLATPLMAAPDEPAHVTKAAAVVRLQFLGTSEPFKKASGISPIITVRVPAAFGHRRPPCYSNHPDRPASCMELLS